MKLILLGFPIGYILSHAYGSYKNRMREQALVEVICVVCFVVAAFWSEINA